MRLDSACINASIISAHRNCILHPHISFPVPLNFSVRTWQLLRHSKTSAFTSLIRTLGREKGGELGQKDRGRERLLCVCVTQSVLQGSQSSIPFTPTEGVILHVPQLSPQRRLPPPPSPPTNLISQTVTLKHLPLHATYNNCTLYRTLILKCPVLNRLMTI